ncbi:hypothetical protein HZC21_03120 [Candidatus Peregrinibacteria bacterium]|nr:hypothetical protein [Candidatus Peregrinibacteria bacterium]
MAGEKSQSEQPLKDRLKDRQFEETASEYKRRFDEMFGGLIDPGDAASSMLRTAIDRLKTDEYLQQAERVRILLSQQWGRIVDLLVERARGEAKIHGNTQKKLDGLGVDLEYYFKSFESYALKFKGLHTPYADKNEKGDTFDTEELVKFEQWAQSLRGLNPAELIDTLDQNTLYENTLLVLQDESGEFQKKLEDDEYLDFHNPKDVEHFMEFILGNDKVEGKKIEKSRFCTQIEYMLWMEIVKKLNYGQKKALVLTFLEKKGGQTTKEFIARCMIGGLITRVEFTHMYKENKDKFAVLGTEDKFDEFLKAAAVEKERTDAELKDYAKQIETPQIRSAIVYFSSFNKLVVETFARCGAITAVLNTALSIVDRWNERKEGESRVGAVLLGCVDALHDPYVVGGTAAAIAGYDYIYPFVRNFINSPDAGEIEHLARNRDYKYLREMRENRHEVTDWFSDHYEDLRFTAKERVGTQARNPRTGKNEERKGEDLYPEDLIGKKAPEELRITAAEAKKMGYDTPEQAMIPIIRMFNICTKVFAENKLDTQDKLEEFWVKSEVYEKEPQGKHA